MRLTLAELLDRWTIELRKAYYGHKNEALIADVEHEIRGQLANLCKGNEIMAGALMATVYTTARLGIVNADIANCEWQIRAGKNLTLVDLGQRAVITRKLNDFRSSVKQNLSETLEQNVETRYYGFGADVDPELMSMEVQEPPPEPLPSDCSMNALSEKKGHIPYDGTVMHKWPPSVCWELHGDVMHNVVTGERLPVMLDQPKEKE